MDSVIWMNNVVIDAFLKKNLCKYCFVKNTEIVKTLTFILYFKFFESWQSLPARTIPEKAPGVNTYMEANRQLELYTSVLCYKQIFASINLF